MDEGVPVDLNVASMFAERARRIPHQRAVVVSAGRDAHGRVSYTHLTFQQLDRESDTLAHGLARIGIRKGTRTLLMVRPGLEFMALTFSLFKVGAVPVLIDPGMRKSGLLECIEHVEPEAMIAISLAHAVRCMVPKPFRSVRIKVTVGRRWFWGGETLDSIRSAPGQAYIASDVGPGDPAAILFTSGSTGPAKGVVYLHGMFVEQTRKIQEFYGIQEGEVDLPAFPLFALFSAAMGMTSVIPDMDPARPARVNPERIVEAIENQGVTNSFGSPALWDRVGRYCVENRVRLRSVRRILMAGAPVAPKIMARMRSVLAPEALIHTPYGATESLPVASIGDREVLDETAALSRIGAGTCVGRPIPGMEVRILKLSDEPIPAWDEALVVPAGVIGEITVSGPVVTREYYGRPPDNARAKIADGGRIWHRMGDLGYLDSQGRLWFCGRKAHRVTTEDRILYSVCCEAVFNEHPAVKRSALVGVGEGPAQRPVIVVELEAGEASGGEAGRKQLVDELRCLGKAREHTRSIQDFLVHPGFPVDSRHNVKINREDLARWAREMLS